MSGSVFFVFNIRCHALQSYLKSFQHIIQTQGLSACVYMLLPLLIKVFTFYGHLSCSEKLIFKKIHRIALN